jgi:hypothetical protein
LRQKAEEADALVPGKGHVHDVAARKIEKDLIPKWGEVPIDTITENMLNDWIADEYRVEDVEATTSKFGRQSRDETRQIVWKKAARTTLGNLDWAFREVWLEAVAQKVVVAARVP